MPSAACSSFKKIIYPLLLFAGVLALHFSWNLRDTNYPADDAGDYAQVAQETYLVAKSEGVLEGLRFMYFHRHWKPVLNQELLVPFLHLKDGDVRAAYRGYSLVISLVFVFAVYLALSLLLPSRFAAFLGTVFLQLAPWMLFNHQNFTAELPWLAFSTWAGYFYLRSDRLRRPGFSYATAFMLVLALLCRPVETSVVLLPAFVAVLLGGARPWWIAAECLVLLAVSRAPYWIEHNLSYIGEYHLHHQAAIAGTWLAYAAAKLWWFRRPGRTEALRAQALWTFTITLVFLWYLPTFRTLWSWVSQTTSGPMVRSSAGYELVGENFLKLFFENGGVLFFLPLLFTRFRDRRFLCFALWGGFSLALVGMFTESRDFRYYQLSWMILYFFGLHELFRLRPGRRWAWSVNTGLVFLIMVQAYGTLPAHYSRHTESWARLPAIEKVMLWTGGLAGPRLLTPDSEFEYFHGEIAALGALNNSEFLFIDPHNGSGVRPLTNPWKYTLRSREQGHLWNFRTYLRRHDGKTETRDFLQHAFGLADYLIVGEPDPETSSAPQENAMASLLFTCAAAGDCAAHGVTPVRRIEFRAEDGGVPFTFRIFRVHREAPRLSNDLECYRTLDYVIR